MSILFQNIVIAIIGIVAVAFLINKYIWTPKKKQSNSCGNEGCGC